MLAHFTYFTSKKDLIELPNNCLYDYLVNQTAFQGDKKL